MTFGKMKLLIINNPTFILMIFFVCFVLFMKKINVYIACTFVVKMVFKADIPIESHPFKT